MLLPADPKANYLAHKDEIDKAIERVLTSGSYILGREVAAFEEAFAREIGVSHAIGVGSGTDALHVALRACQIGAGDAVLTVSHTAGATVSAIALTGALPVLVDVDPVTLTMDPNVLEATVSQFTRSKGSWSGAGRLRGVIPVSLYGHPADMNAIMTIARNYDLRVIEDCAQSHGASIDGRMTGAWGDLSGFSFYPTKNLGALGDGGAVATADPELAARVRLLREYGWRERHVSETAGMNTRLDELHAAILHAKLPYLAAENARRRELARLYTENLQETHLILPQVRPGAVHVYHQYVVRSGRRDQLKAFLAARDIGTLIHYPVPIHLQPAYRGRVLVGVGGLGHTERSCREVLSLPMHPQMSNEDVLRVAGLIVAWDRGGGHGGER